MRGLCTCVCYTRPPCSPAQLTAHNLLQDGTSKMSKSAESDLSRINLLDDANAIRNKVKRAKTDTFEGLEFDHPERPEAHNLLTIYGLMTGNSKARQPGNMSSCLAHIHLAVLHSSSCCLALDAYHTCQQLCPAAGWSGLRAVEHSSCCSARLPA